MNEHIEQPASFEHFFAPMLPEEPVSEALATHPPEPIAAPPIDEAPAEAPIEAPVPPPNPPAAQTAPAQAAEPVPDPKALAQERREKAQASWQHILDTRASGATIDGYVKACVKGGLLIEIDGYRAFLPASQSGAPKGAALDSFVNTTLALTIIDIDETRKRAVVSRRRAVAQERRTARTELLASLKVGEQRNAKVLRLADFGAFVDIGGMDALVPVSELAFERVNKPSDVVKPGDEFPVRILRIAEGGKKIAVSRKAALADPWRDHANVLRQGKIVSGKVVAKEPRLSIEIAPGIVGTLGERDADPNEYALGEDVEVAIRSVDFRNRRLRLGSPHAAAVQESASTAFAPLGIELNKR